MNVLVADKDRAVLSQIAEMIRAWGYEAEESHTGGGTVEKVSARPFDLVLLDISMPDMRAREVITRLKELRPQIGIITMTGRSTKDLEKEIRTLGIIYYMLKPVNTQALKEILDHLSSRIH